MAEISPSLLSDEELAQLALAITSENLEQIASTYLDLKPEEFAQEAIGNQWKFNYNVLKKWKEKTGENATRQALAGKLRTAANKYDVDYREVEKILGVPLENYDSGPKLTNKHILKLSQRITSTEELRVLAVAGLGIESYVVAKNLQGQRHSLCDAAFSLLKEWKAMQDDQVAYTKMSAALKKVNMAYYVDAVLND